MQKQFYTATKSATTRNYNLAFERALLGNFLNCADVGLDPSPGFESVPPENYYLEEHRILTRLIERLVSRRLPPTGPIMFDELLRNYPELRARELMAYFSSLGDGVPRVSPNWFYAEWINRYAGLRKTLEIRAAIANQTDPENIRSLSEQLKQILDDLPPEPSREWPREERSLCR